MSALAVSAEIGSVPLDSGRQKIPYIGMCDLLPKGTLHHWRSVREAYSIRFPLLYSSAFNPSEVTMRSNLVFGAMAYVSNRYLLTRLASKATRKLHRPNTRIQETTNEVLLRFSRVSPIASARLTEMPTAAPLRRAS